jgi:4-hydroxy-tetrahydrodipicolinate synthase
MKKLELSAQKQWALEHYKGMENLFLPSYTPDFKDLDEEGIRHDFNNSIRHGFFSMLITPIGIRSDEENKRFIKVVCDETDDRILKGIMVSQKDLEADLDIIAYAEQIGVTHLFTNPARSLRKAKSEEEIYQVYIKRIQATELPIVLYGKFETYQKSSIQVRVFDRLADFSNVVAIKLTQPMNLTAAFHVCEKLSNRLLVGPVNLDFVSLLAKYYPVQWSGQWNVESVQSPEKPYAVDFLKAINAKHYDKAMEIYKALEPALIAFYKLQAPLIVKGGHPWSHMKYFQWCGGGNGGLIRDTHAPIDQVPILDEAGRYLIKETYKKVGIIPVDKPDEEFLVGKTAYARGIRASDMTETPAYR